jgi:hypothetical protein
VHADSRSAAYDAERLRRLLAGVDHDARRHVMGKLTVVLTKADTLTPPPWISGRRTGLSEGDIGSASSFGLRRGTPTPHPYGNRLWSSGFV